MTSFDTDIVAGNFLTYFVPFSSCNVICSREETSELFFTCFSSRLSSGIPYSETNNKNVIFNVYIKRLLSFIVIVGTATVDRVNPSSDLYLIGTRRNMNYLPDRHISDQNVQLPVHRFVIEGNKRSP